MGYLKVQTVCLVIIAIAAVKYLMPDIRKLCRMIGGEERKKLKKNLKKNRQKNLQLNRKSRKRRITQSRSRTGKKNRKKMQKKAFRFCVNLSYW